MTPANLLRVNGNFLRHDPVHDYVMISVVRFLGAAITAQQFCNVGIGKNLFARSGISKTAV